MKKLLVACALLTLATPSFANDSDNISQSNAAADTGLSQHMVGQSVMDPQNHKIGTIKLITKVNGKDAAIVSVDHMGDDNDVALKTEDLKPNPNGKGVTVAMSASELFNLPTYAPGAIYPLR